jgi:hypothetical protein
MDDKMPQQEAQLSQFATSTGTDTERLVKDAALRLLAGSGDTPVVPLRAHINPLPLWQARSRLIRFTDCRNHEAQWLFARPHVQYRGL